MEPRMVYPTAPYDTQTPHPNIDVPPARRGGGENVESPGKTMGILSKVKNKAKKLRNRIKKVKGSNTDSRGHGDHVGEHGSRDPTGMPSPHSENFDDDEESSHEDEEEVFHKSNKEEFKYEQLRSIGALDSEGDGSEVEVHGGVPVPAVNDNAGSYWENADDSEPMSAYKSAGPPGTLQATPTKYRNYAADIDTSPGGGGTADRKSEAGVPLEGSGRSGKDLSAMSEREFKPDIEAPNRSYDETTKFQPNRGVSDVPVSDRDVSHPVSLASSNLSAEESSAPVFDKIAVMEEDLSADRKLGVGLPSNEHARSGEGNALDVSEPEPEPPAHNKVAVMDKDTPSDDMLGLGLPSERHSGSGKGLLETSVPEGEKLRGSGKGNAMETSEPEAEPEGKRLNLFNSESEESQSKHSVLGTRGASASIINEPYPEDLVIPNPSFGQSSSPSQDKIAVMNEDASPDEKLGLGLSSGEHSGSGKGNLLETSVPEGEELTGFQKSGSGLPVEADELVYRPVSDAEEGSSLTSPPGKLEGVMFERNIDSQGSGTESLFPNHMERQSEELSEKDLAISDADRSTSDDIPRNNDEQKRSLDEASEQPADKGIDTAADGSRENWGKWAADKISNAEGVTISSLVANDLRSDHKDQDTNGNKSQDGSGSTDQIPDKVPESKHFDTGELPAGEDVNQESEEEYYDPNEVKDDQFEQGFALGNAEEDVLSGTLAGSAIETLQGLKNSFQSTLGYSDQDGSAAGGEDRSGPVEGEERALSPSSSQQQQRGGFVEGLRQSVASSLGYGKTKSSEQVGQDTHGLERGVEPEVGVDNRQQQTAPPSFGYDEAGPVEEASQDIDALARQRGSETDLDSSQQQSDGVEEVKEGGLSPSISQEQQNAGVLEGLREESAESPHAIGEAASAKAGHTSDLEERGGESETDLGSQQQQPTGNYQALKNVFASTLGFGAGSGSGSGKQSPTKIKETDSGEFHAEPHVQEKPCDEGETDLDSRQQQLDGADDVKKRGFSTSSSQELEEPTKIKEPDSGEFHAEPQVHEKPCDEGETDLDSRQQQLNGADVKKRGLSPSSSQELEEGGSVRGPKESAENPFRNGDAAASDKVGQSDDVLEKDGVLETDVDSRQQQPTGTYQALKNVFASKLGYGSGAGSRKQSPIMSKESESRELPAELEKHASPDDKEGETDLDIGQQQLDGVEEPKERGLSPSRSEEESAPSPFGEAASGKAGYDSDMLEKGGVSETDLDTRQQQSTGTYQSLKNAFASKLGYGAGAESGEQSPTTIKESDSRELPTEPEKHESIEQQQLDGVEEAKDRGLSPSRSQEESAASPFGEAASGKVGHDSDMSEKGGVSETDLDTRQQQPTGTYQALKNVFASKLGYGGGAELGEQSPTTIKETDSQELPTELEKHESIGQQQLDGAEEVKERGLSPSSSQEESAVSPLGEAASGKAGHDSDMSEKGGVSETDLDTRQQQPTGTYQALKNVFTSKLGYGVGAEPGEQSPTTTKETDSRQFPTEPEKHERVGHDEGETDLDSRPQQLEGVEDGKERQGLESSAESPLVYGETPPDDSNVAVEKTGLDSKQQQPTGTYQALKNVFASKLGYGAGAASEKESPTVGKETEARELPADLEKHESLHEEDEPNLDTNQNWSDREEVQERDLSPRSSQEQQKGGSVEGLTESAASPLGSGEAASGKAGQNDHILEKDGVSETDVDNRQQQPPGTYQALKNVFASKLGYGTGSGSGEQPPTVSKQAESREVPEELEKHESSHDEHVTDENVAKPQVGLDDANNYAGREEEVPEPSPHGPGVLQGLKDRVTPFGDNRRPVESPRDVHNMDPEPVGHNSHPVETHRDASPAEPEFKPESELQLEPERRPEPAPSPGADHPPSSYTQKLFGWAL